MNNPMPTPSGPAAASYDTLEDFKLANRVTSSATDDIIQGELNLATRKIDRCCHRSFWPVHETRIYNVTRNSDLIIPDFRTISSVTLYGVTVDPSEYRGLKLDPIQPGFQVLERFTAAGPTAWHSDMTQTPYNALELEADFGPEDELPPEPVIVCRIIAARLLKMRGLLYQDSGGNDYDSGATLSPNLIDATVLDMLGFWVLPDIPYVMSQ